MDTESVAGSCLWNSSFIAKEVLKHGLLLLLSLMICLLLSTIVLLYRARLERTTIVLILGFLFYTWGVDVVVGRIIVLI